MDANSENQPFESRHEFDEGVTVARTAALAYYDTGVLTMQDVDYDILADRIAATLTANPDWDDQGVTTLVAGGASLGGDVKHPTPMLSLGKSKTLDEITAFVATLNGKRAIVEVKLDGLAIRAEYTDGTLTLAATRGDGSTGENVTAQVLRAPGVNGLPANLNTNWTGEVRGEVFMTDTDFDLANEARIATSKGPFVNPRNATAGSIRNQDMDIALPMSFAAYDIDLDDDLYNSRMVHAAALGFGTAAALLDGTLLGSDLSAPTSDPARVIEVINEIQTRRAAFGFPIDGAVIKANSYEVREQMGAQSRTPRYATSYKYAPDTAITTVNDVEVSVGRTGRLGFRMALEPVFVGGTTITYASGHNAPWLTERDIRVGDTVTVYRAGDVIPRVTTVLTDLRPADSTPWEAPSVCPQCAEPLDRTSLLWRCHTPSCSVVARIVYLASRDCLDITGLDNATAEALVEAGLVNNIADVFDLTVEQIAHIQIGVTSLGNPKLIGQTVAGKIIASRDDARTQPLNRVITSLGIRMTGRTIGRLLATAFGSLDALRSATVEQIAAIDKLGTIKGTFIVNGLRDLDVRVDGQPSILDRLVAFGLTTEAEKVVEGGPLTGLKVVVTGSVPGLSRTEAAEAVIALGGQAAGSVSKATTLVVAGDGAGTKLDKALALGITVMTGEDFAALYAARNG